MSPFESNNICLKQTFCLKHFFEKTSFQDILVRHLKWDTLYNILPKKISWQIRCGIKRAVNLEELAKKQENEKLRELLKNKESALKLEKIVIASSIHLYIATQRSR